MAAIQTYVKTPIGHFELNITESGMTLGDPKCHPEITVRTINGVDYKHIRVRVDDLTKFEHMPPKYGEVIAGRYVITHISGERTPWEPTRRDHELTDAARRAVVDAVTNALTLLTSSETWAELRALVMYRNALQVQAGLQAEIANLDRKRIELEAELDKASSRRDNLYVATRALCEEAERKLEMIKEAYTFDERGHLQVDEVSAGGSFPAHNIG